MTVADSLPALPEPCRERPGVAERLAILHRCAASATPCAAIGFLRMMYASFGGYVPMTILTYLLNEGFAFPFAGMTLKTYFQEIFDLDGASSARHTLVVKLGWMAKPFLGMLSDVLPLAGYRRSSYTALACILGIVSWTFLSLWDMSVRATFPFLVMAGLAFATPDVMIDAYTAEIVKRAPEYASHTQSLNFGAFAIGGILAASVSGLLVHELGPQACFLVLSGCLLSLLIATLMRCLPEERLPRKARGLNVAWLREHACLAGLSTGMTLSAVALTATQVLLDHHLLRLKLACAFTVMIPLGFYLVLRQVSVVLARLALFIFLHGSLHPNYPDTMFQWMLTAPNGPRFSKVVLGWTDFFGSLGVLIAVWIYSNFLTTKTYRCIFASAIIATLITSAFDVLLITRFNLVLGIPDFVLAVGDDALSSCIIRLFRMPVAVLAMKACPAGREGSIMAIILSLGGFGHTLGVVYGSCLLEALGVVRGRYANFPLALLVRGATKLLPLLLVPLLVPPGLRPCDDVACAASRPAEEQEEQAASGSAKHRGADAAVERGTSLRSGAAASLAGSSSTRLPGPSSDWQADSLSLASSGPEPGGRSPLGRGMA